MSYEKQSVLYVDDETANLQLMRQILEKDYKLSFAPNGQKALEVAEKVKPDIILLDVLMPNMDGHETCRRLKEKPCTTEIPIIFVTIMDEEEDETKGFSLGAVDYITKPFVPAIIKARLNTHLLLKRKIDLLESMVSLDGLTEIPNRRRFDEMLESEWHRAQRITAPVSLVLIDIDYFKKYNDNYGHAIGDACLIKVAQAIHCALKRPSDFAARYGGEEFVVILPGTETTGAVAIAEHIRKTIESLEIPHEKSDTSSYVSLSLGVATMTPKQDIMPLELIKAADKSLYQAKEKGRNQWYCEQMHA